jgi:hypothetical protein
MKEIQQMWNMKCFVIPIGDTEIITKGLKGIWKKATGRCSIDPVQKQPY